MLAHGKILFICDDKSYANRLMEQLSDLGDYTLVTESTSQAGLVSLRHSICDLVIIRYAIPDLDILSTIGELKKIDPDCVIVVLLEVEVEGQSNQYAEVGVFETLGWPVKTDKLK